MSEWDWTIIPEHLCERLKTADQQEIFRMLRSGATTRDIANHRRCDYRNAASMKVRIRSQLEMLGYDPENGMTMVSPEPQMLDGRSAYIRRDPNTGAEVVTGYWNKTNVTMQQKLDAALDAIRSLSAGVKPFERVKAPTKLANDLCTVYTLTDFHLGMYAWGEETGADWDMSIAEKVLLNAVADMLQASPDSHTAVFAQLGDLMDWDGLLALTPTAKNVLDADTRFPLLVQTAIRVMLKSVEMILHKHKRVHVLMAEGNHDIASSVWLRAIMSAMFKDNPRVTVETSAFPFYHFVHGRTFLGWHHGHLQKMENLPLLFATDPKFKADYGSCLHTYVHTGHRHQQLVIEKGGVIVEQHPTLAARDAHGARGYLYSNRATKAITYHTTDGEISRVTVLPRYK